MYRIAICEDNRQDLKQLLLLIEDSFSSIGKHFSCTEYSSGEIFLRDAKPFYYDIIFFDIEMHKLNGIQTAQMFRELDSNACIIFTTNYPQHVFSSFSVEPIQYLIKPLQQNDVQSALNHAVQKIERRKNTCFVASSQGTVLSVPVHEIYYFESSLRTINIQTCREQLNFYGKLNQIEKNDLLQDFIRCHQSYLVNPACIRQLRKDGLSLMNGVQLPVSKSRYEHARTSFISYIEKLI